MMFSTQKENPFLNIRVPFSIIKKDLNFLKKSTGIESLFFINNGKIIFVC
ncbi:hypothetical protein ECDEC8E_5309 [Escherichia coli DEC8E]|nr:hypothetical protein ECDEC8E_5309 [Escherichia coli DEC8E]